ncbi:unnamed protein product [Musa acuminata var. zebrina]
MATPLLPRVRAPITHVIFDMDGLLLDTEPFYTLVQEKILARFGKTFDWSLKAQMMGKKAIESARIFVRESGLDGLLTPEAFLEEREGMLQDLFPTCQQLPGVKRLVSHLHAKGIPMCIATGSHKRHFALKTQNHGEIIAMMHHVVMGDDPEVTKGKPSPEVFLAAAKRFEGSVDLSKILVFEDAPSGVAAAKNAGMNVIMVPDPCLDASHQKEADQVLGSLMDFKPKDWGLPPDIQLHTKDLYFVTILGVILILSHDHAKPCNKDACLLMLEWSSNVLCPKSFLFFGRLVCSSLSSSLESSLKWHSFVQSSKSFLFFEEKRSKRRRACSPEPNAVVYAGFPCKYVGYLLPALARATSGAKEQNIEQVVRFQVDMALVLSATGFKWSRALKHKLERSDHIIELQRHPIADSIDSKLQLFLPPTVVVPRPLSLSLVRPKSLSRRSYISSSNNSVRGDDEFSRRMRALQRILPGGSEMRPRELLSEVKSYMVCLQLQVNILRTLVEIH